MHKDPTGTHFIVASKKCSTKIIWKAISKALKLIFFQIQTFYDKSHFYSSFKQFSVIENSEYIPPKIEKVNCKANLKHILIFEFSTLYTKINSFRSDLCVEQYHWLYVIIMSRNSFRVNPHSIVCLNAKELLAQSRRHIYMQHIGTIYSVIFVWVTYVARFKTLLFYYSFKLWI